MENPDGKGTILGLDIGSNSVGWALLAVDKEEKPAGLLARGVRVFKAGLDELSIDGYGKGKSRAGGRREARSARRRLFRSTQRLKNLACLLQQAGLLPEGNFRNSEERHEILTRLDKEFESPYLLRARALDKELKLFELGRALYHLCQRRGFKSNRKTPPKENEKPGEVQQKISELEQKIMESGARTLGEYFSKVDTHKERVRGPQSYTSRKWMYEPEFDKIWEAQQKYCPEILTDDFKKKVYRSIFYQRPLKSQKRLRGYCSLEEGRRRAPWALLCAQKFRYLEKLNSLRILQDGEERELKPEERKKLIEILETEGDLTFTQIKEKLELPPRKTKFNLQVFKEDKKEKILGNHTAMELIKIFGKEPLKNLSEEKRKEVEQILEKELGEKTWRNLSEEKRNAFFMDTIVNEIRTINKDEALKKRAIKLWGLDEAKAEVFSRLELDKGYCNFSRQAIEKLLPFLEKGIPTPTAIKEIYPPSGRTREAKDLLPPIKEFAELRNPVVSRALTETRKIANAIIRHYGKPGTVRVELGREMRLTSKQREAALDKIEANKTANDEAKIFLQDERHIPNPSRRDIEKYLLWKECGGFCPYTGKPIDGDHLFGGSPQFDVEHILPRRYLDNSLFNKTLCCVVENRKKGNRTPYEAYHKTDKWEQIIGRVKKFKGPAKDEKLRRFKLQGLEELGEFISRQLNDTRYAAKWARGYIGRYLYGCSGDDGRVDNSIRVQVSSGQITFHLRNVWDLNSILGDGPGKTRNDHRHHAVDAIVIALTDYSKVELLSEAADRAPSERRRLFGRVDEPWKGFKKDVQEAVKSLITSHRVSKKVRGALHEETFYGKPRKDEKGKEYVHIRKPVSALSEKDLGQIVDRQISECVQRKLRELGGGDPKKKFNQPENHPHMETKDGRKIPIHKVRLRYDLSTFPVGQGDGVRHVQSDRNSHMEIVKDLKTSKWEGHVLSLYDAHQRLRQKEPVIKRNHGEGKKFLFSLALKEIIELDNEEGTRSLYVVRRVPQSKQILFVPLNDARILTTDASKIKDTGKYIGIKGLTGYPETLRTKNCRKVTITPLGEVRYAND